MTPVEVQEALQIMGYITVASIAAFSAWIVWDYKRRKQGGAYRRRW